MTAKATSTTRPTTAPRTGRKPARASTDGQRKTTARKPATGRQTATAKGPAKSNPFDDIARATAAGDDQLARQLAASIGQTKGKPVISRREARKIGRELAAERQATARQAKKAPTTPKDNGKTPAKTAPKATGNGTTFKGRPTSNPDTIAARAKEAGLRIRKDADPADIATRLRATVEATTAWLDSRNGSTTTATSAKAKPTAKAPAKPQSEWLTGITLQHPYQDKKPDYLANRTLVVRYQVRADGTVWATLTQLREADGSLVPNYKDYPLDYRPTQERDGRNRPVILKGDLEGPALKDWLLKAGIASATDIETNTTR